MFPNVLGASVLPPRRAVLLIDMQIVFLDSLKLQTRNRLVQEQIKVIRSCAEVDIPVVVLEYMNYYGNTLKVLTEEIGKVPRNCTVYKSSDNGFVGTRLEDLLSEVYEVDILVPMGIMRSACVIETAKDAVQRGFRLHTSHSLMGDGINLHTGQRSLNASRRSRRWFDVNAVMFKTIEDLVSELRKGKYIAA